MTRKRFDDSEIINIDKVTQRTNISDLTRDYLKNRRELESAGND